MRVFCCPDFIPIADIYKLLANAIDMINSVCYRSSMPKHNTATNWEKTKCAHHERTPSTSHPHRAISGCARCVSGWRMLSRKPSKTTPRCNSTTVFFTSPPTRFLRTEASRQHCKAVENGKAHGLERKPEPLQADRWQYERSQPSPWTGNVVDCRT